MSTYTNRCKTRSRYDIVEFHIVYQHTVKLVRSILLTTLRLSALITQPTLDKRLTSPLLPVNTAIRREIHVYPLEVLSVELGCRSALYLITIYLIIIIPSLVTVSLSFPSLSLCFCLSVYLSVCPFSSLSCLTVLSVCPSSSMSCLTILTVCPSSSLSCLTVLSVCQSSPLSG